NLPDSRGLATLEAIRRASPDVPIIILTGMDDQAMGAAAIEMGADDYLVKGRVDAEALRRSLLYSAERRRAERRFRTVVDQAPVGIAILRGGKLEYANLSLRNMIGYSQTELEELQSIAELIVPEERDHARRLFHADAPMSGGAERVETRILTADGRVLDVEIHRVSIELGAESAVVGFVLDRTEEKHATEVRALLASIVESSGDAIVGKTPDGVIWAWNQSAERIFGYTAEEAIGQNIAMLIPPDRADEYRQVEESLSHGDRIENLITQRIRKDGTIAQISVTISPLISENGKVVGAAAISRDITEQTRMERQKRELSRLEGIGKAAATVAHEFNNVLMAVGAWAAVIERSVHEPEKVSSAVERLSGSIERGRRISAEILQFGKPMEMNLTVVDLTRWLKDFEQELSAAVGGADRLVVRVEEGSLVVRADPHRLMQVLTNLLTNARDATPAEEPVVIHAGRCPPELRPLVLGEIDRFTCVGVTDCGAGMSGETLSHIFEPLFTTKKGRGTGFGLAVVRQIITGFGGEIFVESAPGKGTTFRLLIPREPIRN
ncbi:MAG: PAS domain S-box protein, partial [Thermoanaerobaculia bacterium]